MPDILDPNAELANVDKAKATAKLLWPQKRMASCMPIGLVRDTRGANLPFKDRFNNFSASPYCAISWVLQGSCRVSADIGGEDPSQWLVLPKVFVSGPNQTPTVSWNDDDVYMVTLGFLPDAWHALTGIDVSEIAHKHFDAVELLPREFEPCFDVFTSSGNLEQEYFELQNFLSPIWESRRPNHAVLPNGLVDWANRGLSQLSTNGVGRSARQLQRRIKQWTGLSQRQIAAHARGEELYKSFLAKRERGDVNISQIALENGYADQSHLGRDVKRITGLSPKQLDQLFDEEERFWYYRLLRDFY